LPADATALSLNVTAVRATLPTFLTIWPTGAAMPTASSLNPFPDAPPAPNAVTVDLSGDGRFNVYNLQGQVHVLADVVGYYAHHTHDDRYYTRAQVDAELAAMRAEIDTLEAKLANITVTEVDGHPTVRFSGVNVQIVDGTGDTPCGITGFEACNGRGNLVVGYHEDLFLAEPRTGSHNVVTGVENDYTSYSGIIAGASNTTTGPYATITGGVDNTANGDYSSISGGSSNAADGDYSTISGGQINNARGMYSSVTGGIRNRAVGDNSSVTGGQDNHALGDHSSVTGGDSNYANSDWSSVSGGQHNDAGGDYSSVSGGIFRSVSGAHDWRAGGLFETN
jgi:hypothetical protein